MLVGSQHRGWLVHIVSTNDRMCAWLNHVNKWSIVRASFVDQNYRWVEADASLVHSKRSAVVEMIQANAFVLAEPYETFEGSLLSRFPI